MNYGEKSEVVGGNTQYLITVDSMSLQKVFLIKIESKKEMCYFGLNCSYKKHTYWNKNNKKF